jgi:hypothetical protein
MQFKKHLDIAAVSAKNRLGGISFRVVMGSVGLMGALLMLVWLITSALGLTVSMIDVFGMEGVRIPAGIAIGGLMLAAIGFNKF